MKSMPKTELVHFLTGRVQRHLDVALSNFQYQSAAILLKPSATGGWSIAQCLDHLNSYGDFYLPEIKSAITETGSISNPNFQSGWLGGYFAKMMEPSAKKFKALKGHRPVPELDAHAVVAKFIIQQEELIKYLDKAQYTNLNKRIATSISPLIKLKLGDVFQFLIAHNERHIQQALRNQNELDMTRFSKVL